MTQSCTRQSQCKYLYVTENVYVYTHVLYMYMKVAEVPSVRLQVKLATLIPDIQSSLVLYSHDSFTYVGVQKI